MEDLARKLTGAAERFAATDAHSSSLLPREAEAMRESAILWSKVCIQEFRDDLCRKGLMVSAAITDFLAELETSLGRARPT